MTRSECMRHIADTYDIQPDYPFPEDAVSAVFRHLPSRKWFALLMRVDGRHIGLADGDPVDILNLKCDPLLIGSLRGNPGVYPAYHMNKEHWITVLLSAVDDEALASLIGMSYRLTGPKKKRPHHRKRSSGEVPASRGIGHSGDTY